MRPLCDLPESVDRMSTGRSVRRCVVLARRQDLLTLSQAGVAS